ncbi:D-alanyl-D-alanine carboxypeptidase family protein [Microbacterium sp. RU33B]|uniref:D-alanyl-D-alanine carboxypeptidase family protein n=1 Tax=Microbacterium sp. RU33B TaxID=1907390 RepID=UPI00096034A4|nr:D-alanyl-D-alanine carboxypeptidase [Microbacterium sp. RU33B]SIT86592.1 D-alanyl-D-alanine carboxypeptidase (penicillin-binding protein 5/6) [Microbacterium sp. RU33B]
MTPADVPPPTRRSLRATDQTDAADATAILVADPVVAPAARDRDAHSVLPPRTSPTPGTAGKAPAPAKVAFAWVDESVVATGARPALTADATGSALAPASADLLASAPRRSPFRPGVIIPILLILALFGVYGATTLLWPLHAVAPEVTAVQVEPVAAPAAAPVWPAEGSAGIAVRGISGSLSSSAEPQEIASITKVVTALLVLEEMPLAVGETGPEYRFTANDRSQYQGYRNRGESALNVPVGGSLTQYQLLQGMLIGSANNYADRLASNLWPSDAVFARAANEWLASHGVPGITVVEPTGFDTDNVATNEALLILATKALANPVIAEIVRTPSVELPGAGLVTNTNDLLADPGVLGIKTGALDRFNLLSAKDIVVGDVTIRLTASVLSQPDPEARSAATRALFAQLEAELQPTTTVAAGTTAGVVETKWGARADVVTADAAPVILWNGGAATLETEYSLGDSRAQGDQVGTLTATGPFGSTSVALRLDGDIEPPDAWWRLTHPLDLFGLAG